MQFEAVLVRHGQTEWSENGRHTSGTDIPLTPDGEFEATSIAPRLAGREFGLVLSSPLQRARLTCEIAGFADEAELRDDLREWNYGDLEGRTTAQIRRDHPDWLLWRDGCPGGESPADVARRCDRVIAELIGHAEHGSGDALLFAHGHILRSLAARWCELGIATGRHLALGTAAISTLGFERETRAIKLWNSTP